MRPTRSNGTFVRLAKASRISSNGIIAGQVRGSDNRGKKIAADKAAVLLRLAAGL